MMNNSDKDVRKLFKLHSSRGSAPVKHDAASDFRKMAGAPGRMMAGAPGRMMAGSYRTMSGPKLTIEEKASPLHNPIVRKLMFPKSIQIRIPDNNRIPTVEVNYANFSTLRVGTDIPMSPYYIFLPAHNIGLFAVGGVLTANGVTRFLPTMILPSSRDLTAYTRARNVATRVGVRAGSISAANVALKGTFNGCSFNEIRDFVAFDVAEFSTRCITISDYVQGVRSDNGVTFISGPEMIPDLRPIQTTELYGDEDSLQIRFDYDGKALKSAWQTWVIYDYFDKSSDRYGPLIGDNTLTFLAESLGTAASTGTSFQAYVSITITRSTLSAAGAKVDKEEKVDCNILFCVDGNKISFSLTTLLPPPAVWVGWITKISFSLYVGDLYDYRLRVRVTVPGQFAVGTLGPGFALAGLGFDKDGEIVTDVTRAMAAVAGGVLLLDVKANMTAYTPTKMKHLERAIMAFNTPALPVRRVYTKYDFFNYALSVHGVRNVGSSGMDPSSYDTEDRIMAGPISGIIKGVAPMLSMIPGIGGIASSLGGILGGVADGLGFSGPTGGSETVSMPGLGLPSTLCRDPKDPDFLDNLSETGDDQMECETDDDSDALEQYYETAKKAKTSSWAISQLNYTASLHPTGSEIWRRHSGRSSGTHGCETGHQCEAGNRRLFRKTYSEPAVGEENNWEGCTDQCQCPSETVNEWRNGQLSSVQNSRMGKVSFV